MSKWLHELEALSVVIGRPPCLNVLCLGFDS